MGAHIQLGMEGISVECYTTIEAQPKPEYIDTGTSFFFPYAVHDDLLTGRKLAKIATPVPIDWEETPHLSYSELYTNDYLFEVLVECANPKHLNRWFKTSLRG